MRPRWTRGLRLDPDRSEAKLYAYAANNPVTEIDPDGTCFVVCQLVVGAIIDTVVYLATTENASLGGLVGTVARGAVESAVNPLAKLGKVSKLISAAGAIQAKISKGTRLKNKVRYSGGAWRTPDGRFARNPNIGPSPSAGGRAGKQQRLRELGMTPSSLDMCEAGSPKNEIRSHGESARPSVSRRATNWRMEEQRRHG